MLGEKQMSKINFSDGQNQNESFFEPRSKRHPSPSEKRKEKQKVAEANFSAHYCIV